MVRPEVMVILIPAFFQVAKLSTDPDATQQSGGLYKIIEDSTDGTGLTFRWEKFKQGGEAGSETGAGFANVDNLVFDYRANLWGVIDMSTDTHNGLVQVLLVLKILSTIQLVEMFPV